jgi:hypothetical protein
MNACCHSAGELLSLAALWPDVDAWLRESSKFPAAKIAAIGRRMQGGDILPPVFVRLRHDGKFHVIDGAHRIAASLALGFSHIPALHDEEANA